MIKTKLSLFFATLLLIAIGNFSIAQARDFDGLWEGKININDGSTVEIKIFIEDNNVYATYIDSDGDLAKDLQKEITWSGGFGEQLTFVWSDVGGIWTETQVFSLAWISSTKLSCYYTRHVSNKAEGFDGNTDWGAQGTGYLYVE